MADLGWCKTHDLPGDDDSSCCWKCRGEIEAARQAKRDSVLLAAREEGRREGYAALQEQADAHRADILRMEAEYDGDMATGEKRGYAAPRARRTWWRWLNRF